MSDPPAPGVGSVDRVGTPTDARMVPAIKVRRDVDGCGCLECRSVEAATTRRSIVDSLAWSVRLARAYPSVPLLALSFVLAGRLLEAGMPHLVAPVAGLLEAAIWFGLVVLVRGQVATIAAGELTGDRIAPTRALRHSLARTPAVIGLLAALVATLSVVWLLSSIPTFAVFVLLAFAPVEPTSLVAASLLVALPVVAFAVVPTLVVVFKFWLAVEACIVGGYGPVEAFRVSWRLTTSYRWKILAVAVALLASAGVLFVAALVPGPGVGTTAIGPVLEAAFTSLGELTAVLWYGVYAHLYVQAAVDG